MFRDVHVAIFGLCLLAGSAYATEPITLVCRGSWWATESDIRGQELPDQSMIINFDAGKVSSSLGEFDITSVTDTKILFAAPFQESGKVAGHFSGGIDRISGAMSLAMTRDFKTYPIVYQLVCKTTRAMF